MDRGGIDHAGVGRAWIDGRPATLDAAAAEAARLLADSCLPVIAGLGTDVAGARAAIALAERLGGAVDHMHAGSLLRDLDVAREARVMLTTPNEARVRADTVLLVGPDLSVAWPDLAPRLLDAPMGHEVVDGARHVFALCPGRSPVKRARETIEAIGRNAGELPDVLAALRARLAGRPVGKLSVSAKRLDALATALQAARFGVVVWSSASLDALSIEMLCGLVADLNARTRFSGLPLAPADNAAGVLQVCGWMTGFPMRTGFGRGSSEHDPWRFDAVRMVESGEADCALWISAYRSVPPPWTRKLPTIVLGAVDVDASNASHVHIAVGRPSIDHDAVEYLAATGTLAAIVASKKNDSLSVADAIGRIAAHLRPDDRPC
jgi:formylmethanofuran dehydrogenase subunit B